MSEFGKVIKNQRIKLNMSKSDVAKLSNISRRTIIEIEQGLTKKPKLETLSNLSKTLELNIDDLIDIIDYTDEELESFFSHFRESKVEYKIIMTGCMNVSGLSEEDIINECAYKIATAFSSVDGITTSFDQLKSNSNIEILMNYLGDDSSGN